jgi:hypothetical protein
VQFEIIGEIEQVQTIASGRGVKVRSLLHRIYGRGRWRTRKGVAMFGFRTVHSGELSYIGTKRMVLADETSRLRRI